MLSPLDSLAKTGAILFSAAILALWTASIAAAFGANVPVISGLVKSAEKSDKEQAAAEAGVR